MALLEIEKNLDYWEKTIFKTTTFQELDKEKVSLIGKSGIITSAFKLLANANSSEKKEIGERLNKARTVIENAIKTQFKRLENYYLDEKIKNESLDVTLPVLDSSFGGLHIITQTINRLKEFYQTRGFQVLDGPEIETEFFNFDALNIPKHHPARQSHDTFYIEGFEETLLRTHTSTIQIRTLKEQKLPIRMVSIGKTYRNDQLDATHSPMFHQIECLVADREPISIGQLKSELRETLSYFFEVEDIDIRFRPSFFPFTEPGMEFDCKYTIKNGKLVITSKSDKWIELGGAGLVHPNVFKNCGIEDKVYGFAYAFGIDRLVMLKNGIRDIRYLFDTDKRWLKHYGSC